MTVATLSAEVSAALRELAWEQWSQLGLSAAAPERREERAADPEALLLFTLEVGRAEPRLFDEVLDWLALNEPLVSVHRLRNLCTTDTERALVAAVLDWTAGERGRRQPAAGRAQGDALEPLFPAIPTPARNLDPAFARHGFARTQLQRSGKSQAPRFREPISFAFRLRRLLGVGVRAEAMRALLTIRAPRLSGKVITASAAFAPRNVREGLVQLDDAGAISTSRVADDRYYSVNSSAWAALLGLESALPFHYDWIPALRALTQIARWLQQPGVDELSPYLLASQARTLVEQIEADLRFMGFVPSRYTARGADFWEDFVEVVRVAIRHARIA
jgi:hypothetical protein